MFDVITYWNTISCICGDNRKWKGIKMFDVITYWNTISCICGDNRKWNELHPQEQHNIVSSIQLLLSVVRVNNPTDQSSNQSGT